MQIQLARLIPLLYVFTTVSSAVISLDKYRYVMSSSNDYSDSESEEPNEKSVVGSGDGSHPLDDLDAEEEVFTTEIIELSTALTTTLKPTTTQKPPSRVRIPETCCEFGALSARQGYSCRPEDHREILISQATHGGSRLGNRLFKTKTASQTASEDHKRVEDQLRKFSKCVTGISRKWEEDFMICCKRTSKELDDEKRLRDDPYMGHRFSR